MRNGNLKMKVLNNVFNIARKEHKNHIVLFIYNEQDLTSEYIIFEKHSFDKKQEYYNKAYDDNLRLKSFNKIRILSIATFDFLSFDGLLIENI